MKERTKEEIYKDIEKDLPDIPGEPFLTPAAMRYLETQDIYRVMKELGHTSLKETVKYANLRLSKVSSDFPSLNLDYNGAKQGKNDKRDTLVRDTEPSEVEVASR